MKDQSNTICVSVIIPVYNEEKYITKCLDSLISQTYPQEKTEWIVIDGNSTDNTPEILARYAKTVPMLILFNEKRSTPVSLNMGIKQARGKYIIRFDAHAEFPEDYIEKCVHCLDTVDADNVGGLLETRGEGFLGEAIAKILSSKFGVGGSGFRTGARSCYTDTVPFGAFRREVFDKVGLFNEELLRSEDNDINERIIANGGKVFLSDDICSIYYCRNSVPAFLKQGLQNGNALFRTIRKNPKAMRLRHFIPFLFLVSLLVLLVAGCFFAPAGYLLLAELAVYLSLDIRFSFFCGSPEYGLATIWLYPLFHLSYGLGSLLGLIGIQTY